MSRRLLKRRMEACQIGGVCFLCSGDLGRKRHRITYNKVGRVTICDSCNTVVQRIKDEDVPMGAYDHDGSITITNTSTGDVLIRGRKVELEL